MARLVKGEVLSEWEEALIHSIAISKLLLKIKHRVLKDKAKCILFTQRKTALLE